MTQNLNSCSFQGPITTGPLATGVQALWTSGSAQTIYTLPSAASGLIIFHIVLRGAVGTQPLTVTISAGGVSLAAAISISLMASTQYLIITPSQGLLTVPVTGSVTATPAAASSGASCLFDLFGYWF